MDVARPEEPREENGKVRDKAVLLFMDPGEPRCDAGAERRRPEVRQGKHARPGQRHWR